jgi:HEAT repeat protein
MKIDDAQLSFTSDRRTPIAGGRLLLGPVYFVELRRVEVSMGRRNLPVNVFSVPIVPLIVAAVVMLAAYRGTDSQSPSGNTSDRAGVAGETKATNRPMIESSTGGSNRTGIDRIDELVNSLRSPEESVRAGAERELLQLASSFSDNRHLVISRLLKSVDDVEALNGRHSVISNALPFWASVTDIFAKTKAMEAIDILIRCIHCGNGYTGSLAETPAFDALIQIGQSAVPQLSQAQRDPNGYKRSRIALCLGCIGGRKARAALERSSRTEREKDVRDYIRFVLAEMR